MLLARVRPRPTLVRWNLRWRARSLAFFAAIASAFLTILTWPAAPVWVRTLFGWRAPAEPVQADSDLGLDGMDHGLTENDARRGKLPNLAI